MYPIPDICRSREISASTDIRSFACTVQWRRSIVNEDPRARRAGESRDAQLAEAHLVDK